MARYSGAGYTAVTNEFIYRTPMKSLFAFVLFATVTQVHALDVYIGTLESKNGQVVLTRCDIVKNKYTLVDQAKIKDGAVKKFLNQFRNEKTPVYGEVIGEPERKNGLNILTVASIESVEKGKSCHLLDLIEKNQVPDDVRRAFEKPTR
jgi:hypothetical protein